MDNQSPFSFSVNFQGINASGMGRREPVEGYFQGRITEAYINQERNPNRCIFKVEFEGDFAGVTKLTGLNLPGTTQNDTRPLWRALMESVGYNSQQLDQGQVNVTPQAVLNRTCCFYFRPKDESALDGPMMYDKLKFLAPGHWQSAKTIFDQDSGSTTQAASTTAAINSAPQTLGGNNLGSTQAKSGFAAPSMSSQDLLNMVK